ncbi:type IV-A pilus assembly ATPase PilB, partial [Aeromonas dhakensis]|nr:type IV-A pilus assembly ATPase PilB [Aeromonas dhakensis]
LRLFKPVGCKECSGGYKGRVGIYEILLMSENIAKLIMQGANSSSSASGTTSGALQWSHSLRASR